MYVSTHTQPIGPALLVRLECADPIDEEDGGVPSFLPSDPGAIDLTKDLSPKAQALLRVASPDGGPIGEAGFRAALAADACGTQVFAQGMKLFLTVRVGVGGWGRGIRGGILHVWDLPINTLPLHMHVSQSN